MASPSKDEAGLPMRRRRAVLFALPLLLGLVPESARAASYQQIDGTIVDPIRLNTGAPHPYAGPNLAPSVVSPAASLAGANLVLADLSGATGDNANFSGASLDSANLSTANMSGANFSGASLAGANLSNSILTGANFSRAYLNAQGLESANLMGAIYGSETSFPSGFNPTAAGMITGPIVINNGLAPPNPANVIDASDLAFVVNNEGCNSLIEHPCATPGGSTSASGVVGDVAVYETSSFSGAVRYSVSLHDAATGNVSLDGAGAGASVSGTASLVVSGNGLDLDHSLYASGDSFARTSGRLWDNIRATDRAHVIHAGGEVQGSDLHVSGDALLESYSNAYGISANGGRMVLHAGEISLSGFAAAGATIENRGARLEGSGIFGPHRFLINGTFLMTGGSIGPAALDVDGYALISGGAINADAHADEQSHGPWNFLGSGHGVIELSGASFDQYASLGARDASRIRVFGSGFAVDASPIGFGSIPSATGTLSGTLASGIAIDNAFAHKGGTCGGLSCTGRVLVLAPGLDWDGDAIPNPFDNCAEERNLDQTDANLDGTGDACFASVDLDHDTVTDALDNCRVDANADQADADSDGVGDACDESLVFWADQGIAGCTLPPRNQTYAPVTTDLADDQSIDRSLQPCNCFGIELPADPSVASVRFVLRRPSGTTIEVCENAAPFALGLAPGQSLCSTSLNQDGTHELMATPYDAPNCEAGTGTALPSSIRRFHMTPEPGLGVLVASGLVGLTTIARRGGRRGARRRLG
jgi:uncharacterized protein YjbI with pentapeptide repeats